jgi:excisionase family DNA binding protein
MSYTLGMAARATGLSKSTIYRAIKSGRISAGRSDTGDYAIDPAELHRVFPPLPADDEDTSNGSAKHGATGTELNDIALEKARLEAEVAASSLVTALLRQQLEETRQDRDHWRGQAQRLVLPPPTPATMPSTTPAVPLSPAPARVGFLARLFGRTWSTGNGPAVRPA